MRKGAWKKRIKNACELAGTYRPFFDETIETLATILEKRDEAQKAYKDSGSLPIVTHTNKAGATNYIKNPALVLWDDLNKSALAYWRDFGLTPAGLKKIDETMPKKKKENALERALKDLGG